MIKRLLQFGLLLAISALSWGQATTHSATWENPNVFLSTNQFTEGITVGPILFATLGAVPGGTTMIYVSDATFGSSPCTGGGTGALAIYINGAWNCGAGGGGGGGGPTSFNLISNGVNSTANMVCTTGCSISATSSGSIIATGLSGTPNITVGTVNATNIVDSLLNSGNCVQSGTGGQLTTIVGPCVNTALSNLAVTTAVNASLVPGSNTIGIGTNAAPWNAGYFTNLTITGAANFTNASSVQLSQSTNPIGVGDISFYDAYTTLTFGNGEQLNYLPFWPANNPTPVAGDCLIFAGSGGMGLAQQTCPSNPGTINLALQYAPTYYSGVGASNILSGISPATVNGNYTVIYPVTGGVAGAPLLTLGGVPVDATNPSTLLYTDRATYINWTSGSTLTLPAATGNLAYNFPFVIKNTSGGAVALTPTAPNNIDGGSSQAPSSLANQYAAFVYQDALSPANWWTIKIPLSGSGGTVTSVGLTVNGTSPSGIFTVTGSPVTGSSSLNVNIAGTNGGVACFTSGTLLASSSFLQDNAVMVGGGVGACPSTVNGLTYNSPTLAVGVQNTYAGDISVKGSASAGGTIEICGDGAPCTSSNSFQLGVTAAGTTLSMGSNASLTNAGALTVTSCSGCGGGGDTITSPNSTLNIGGTTSATTLDLAGAVGEIMAGATPALTYTPSLGKSGTAGTLSLYPASGNFTTTLGSAATASNTVNFFATVPANNDLFYCAVSSTTCTLTDAGYAYNAIPNTDLAHSAITIAGTAVSLGGSTTSFPSPGVIGGTTPAAITGTIITATYNGTASQSSLGATGAPYTGGSGTTNFPLFYLNDGSAVTTFPTGGTEIGVNAPSGFTGDFEYYCVNGVSPCPFQVTYQGNEIITQTAGTQFALNIQNTTAATSSTAQNSPYDIRSGTAWYNPEFDTTSPPVAAASVQDCWSHQVIETNGSNGISIYNIAHNNAVDTCTGSPANAYVQVPFSESYGLQTNAISSASSPTVALQGSGTGGTWTYGIVACVGPECAAVSGTTSQTGPTTLNTTNWMKVTWSAVIGADFYEVYRTASGGTPSSLGGVCLIPAGVTLECDDKGLTGDATTAQVYNQTAQVYVGAGPKVGGGTGGGYFFTNGTAPSTLVSTASGMYGNATNTCFDIVNGIVDTGCAVAALTPSKLRSQILTANSSAITATTPGTTVWTWGALPVSQNFSFKCEILYNQQGTAVAGDGFAVQGATNAPTRLDAWGKIYTTDPASTTVTGSLGSAQNITSTTATSVVTATPGAITTVYQAELAGTIQVGASASTLNINAFTGNVSDSITIQAGSYCTLMP